MEAIDYLNLVSSRKCGRSLVEGTKDTFPANLVPKIKGTDIIPGRIVFDCTWAIHAMKTMKRSIFSF